ncbi:expressed protein [Echinococcus multilocularis]|uniref:Expressed protein n=1 Tax=Echinococcus multilocularis TaxID=6211 RepID=A0A068YKJ3_ECHMU|nr:expressed protein [Echinococcus multilocularis]
MYPVPTSPFLSLFIFQLYIFISVDFVLLQLPFESAFISVPRVMYIRISLTVTLCINYISKAIISHNQDGSFSSFSCEHLCAQSDC